MQPAVDGMMLGYHKDGNPKHFMTMQRRQLSPTKLPASEKQGEHSHTHSNSHRLPVLPRGFVWSGGGGSCSAIVPNKVR